MSFTNFDDVLQVSLLYDFYGELLTERQKEIMELYHEENYSIVEISSELGITKQGVHEALKKSEKLLYSYEEKLGLVSKFLNTGSVIEEVRNRLDSLSLNDELKEKVEEIKNILNKIED
ncbi:MAG: YlxM family DNA-binding protein [Clostridia bacterium]|nr:YlxM family DNA-binding protein [Clostridia bacterium]